MSELGSVAKTQQALRPITDQKKFQAGLGKLQNHMREKYGYAMPYEQAVGWLRGDPSAKKTVNVSLKTLAFKDQVTRDKVANEGLSGTYMDDQGVEQPSLRGRQVTALERGVEQADTQLGLDQQTTDISMAGTLGGMYRDYTLDSFGLYGVGYSDEETKRILRERGSERVGRDLNDIEIIKLMNGEEISIWTKTVTGREVTVEEGLFDFKKYAFEEDLGFKRWAITQGQAQEVTMAGINAMNQQERDKLQMGGYRDASGTWIMGSSSLEQHKIDTEAQLKRDGMSDEDARFYASLEVEEARLYGVSRFLLDAAGNLTFDEETGQIKTYWVHGSAELDLLEITARESIADKNIVSAELMNTAKIVSAETLQKAGITADKLNLVAELLSRETINKDRITSAELISAARNVSAAELQAAGITSAELMNAANILSREHMADEAIAWERMQLEGYDYNDARGVTRHIFGTQEWDLIGDAQRRNGFSAVVQVGVDETGAPMWRSMRFLGTQEYDLLEQNDAQAFEKSESELNRKLRRDLEDIATQRGITLAQLQWDLGEKKRNGYNELVVDFNGNPVLTPHETAVDADGNPLKVPSYNWVYGEEWEVREIQRIAQENNISTLRVQEEISKHAAVKRHTYELIYKDVDKENALERDSADRLWRTLEASLERTFKLQFQNRAFDSSEKIEQIRQSNESRRIFIEGLARGGAALLLWGVKKYFSGTPEKQASDELLRFAAHTSGRTATKQYWLDEGVKNEKDAQGLADHYRDNPLFGEDTNIDPRYEKEDGLLTPEGDARYRQAMDEMEALGLIGKVAEDQAEAYAKGGDKTWEEEGPLGEGDGVWTPVETPLDKGGPISLNTGQALTKIAGETHGYLDGDGVKWIEQEDGSFLNTANPDIPSGFRAEEALTLSDSSQLRINPADPGRAVAEDGTIWQSEEDGRWTNPSGKTLSSLSGTEGSIDWDRLQENLTPLNLIYITQGLMSGWDAGGDFVYDDFRRENPGLSVLLDAKDLGVMALTSPRMAVAHFVARTARMIYEFESGNLSEHVKSYQHIPSGGAVRSQDLAPKVDTKGRQIAGETRGKLRMSINFLDGKVVWLDTSNRTVSEESLDDFIDRAGFVPVLIDFRQDKAWRDLPQELREELPYRPRYAWMWKNSKGGGITFWDEDGGNGHFVSSEDQEKYFQAPVKEPLDPMGADEHGVMVESTLFDSVVTQTNMSKEVVTAMTGGLPDERRIDLLQKLAERTPFTRQEVDYFFEEKGSQWNEFIAQVDSGQLILLDRSMGEEENILNLDNTNRGEDGLTDMERAHINQGGA